jgi:hypothetical protein
VFHSLTEHGWCAYLLLGLLVSGMVVIVIVAKFAWAAGIYPLVAAVICALFVAVLRSVGISTRPLMH